MLLFPCPLGCEDLLEGELLDLGAERALLRRGSGVVLYGDAARDPAEGHAPQAMRLGLLACLHSRIASRSLLVLAKFPFTDDRSLYEGVRAMPWHTIMAPSASLAIDCPRGEGQLHHTQYAAQVCKDGLVDALRAATGQRPDVDLQDPDVRIHLLLRRGEATVSFDLAGEALHRRGYRGQAGPAPLKENLAAAMLMRARWPARAAAGERLVDPMCGSATLLIEAGWMAANMPPSALRRTYALTHWLGLDAGLWQALLAEAHAQAQQAVEALAQGALAGRLLGYDVSPSQVAHARDALDLARLDRTVHVDRRAVEDLAVTPAEGPGLIVCNPPYGERMAPGQAALMVLYGQLGAAVRRHAGWSAHVLVADRELGHALGLRAVRMNALRNGPLPCTLLHFAPANTVSPARKAQLAATAAMAGPEVDAEGPRRTPSAASAPAPAPVVPQDPGVVMLMNRLAKNQRRLGKWAEREAVGAWRLYDGDLPEYNAAIDIYDGTDGRRRLHVQEYSAPIEVSVAKAEQRLRALVQCLPQATGTRPDYIFLKTRRRTQPTAQYGAQGEVADAYAAPSSRARAPARPRPRPRAQEPGKFFQVLEGGLRYWVSLDSYIDTGLYLDHRRLRARLRNLAAGKDALNLFCYTGSATVAMAAGGARSTTSVDLSHTYLSWAEDNLQANDLMANAALVNDEVEAYLAHARMRRQQFDLVFCGPPTFTNSKRARDDFDVLQDHVRLIEAAMKLLRPGGQMVFSSHARKLRLDEHLQGHYQVEDWTQATLPEDFAGARPHRTWSLRPRD